MLKNYVHILKTAFWLEKIHAEENPKLLTWHHLHNQNNDIKQSMRGSEPQRLRCASSPFTNKHRAVVGCLAWRGRSLFSLALRVHDEGLEVGLQFRHQRVHKVLDGGSSLQHPWRRKTQQRMLSGCGQWAWPMVGKTILLVGDDHLQIRPLFSTPPPTLLPPPQTFTSPVQTVQRRKTPSVASVLSSSDQSAGRLQRPHWHSSTQDVYRLAAAFCRITAAARL